MPIRVQQWPISTSTLFAFIALRLKSHIKLMRSISTSSGFLMVYSNGSMIINRQYSQISEATNINVNKIKQWSFTSTILYGPLSECTLVHTSIIVIRDCGQGSPILIITNWYALFSHSTSARENNQHMGSGREIKRSSQLQYIENVNKKKVN